MTLAPYDRSLYNFLLVGHCKYNSIVVPFSSYLSLNNRDFEIWVIGHWRSFKLVPFESFDAVSYLPFIVTMALSCINSEIKRDIGRKLWFLIPLAFGAPVWEVPVGIVTWCLVRKKLEWCGYQRWKFFEDMFTRFDSMYKRVRRTDRQTDRHTHTHTQTDGHRMTAKTALA